MKDRLSAVNASKDEQSPMISPVPPDRANNGAIDISCDLPPRRAWFSSRFNHLYCLICLLAVVMISVLIICFVIVSRLTAMEGQAEAAVKQIPLSINRAVESIKIQLPPGIMLPPGLPPALSPQQMTPPPGVDPVEADSHGPEEHKKEAQESEWHDESCAAVGKCTRSDMKEPPLVILSFDGFAREYLDRGIVRTFQKIASCGATAERVIPSFPSRTFPNHYTVSTGLYPESHGIVDNYVFDPSVSKNLENMKNTKYSSLWMGDPIWSVYKRQTGKTTACLFWPGCAYNASGFPPDISPPYNKDFPFRNRFNLVREWLNLPADKRPGLITAYFDQPDTAGHYQLDDDDVSKQLVELDHLLDEFLTQLKKDGILECINLLIVSDHGMQRLNKTVIFEKLIDTEGIITTSGVIGRIYKNGTKRHVNELIAPFSCKKGEEMRVFTRQTMPNRKHYSRNGRVGDVIVQGEPGTTFVSKEEDDYHLSADHGFDYHSSKMHTIFFGRGPSIAKKVVLPAFQNIEYLNLFMDLLGLKPDAPNNGTTGRLDAVMRDTRQRTINTPPIIQECPLSMIVPSAQSCSTCTPAEQNRLSQLLLSCSTNIPQFQWNVPQFGATHPVCFQNYCNKTLVVGTGSGKTTILTEHLSAGDEFKESCEVFNKKYAGDRCRVGNGTASASRYLTANPKSEFGRIASTEFVFGEGFSNGVIDALNDLTMDYVGRFRRLTVVTGVAFDENLDGHIDIPQLSSPTHLFRMLISCSGPWGTNGFCENPNDLNILSFIFPIAQKDFNCLPVDKLLLEYTARVKDIELLAGLEFIPRAVPRDIALRLRTHINMQLW